VSQGNKLLAKILLGASDANIPFNELCQLLSNLGFEERIRGSHHIFSKDGIEEILNLQPKGGKAKAYQVRQVRAVILKYQLGNQDDNTV
jgi:HicA toxin of bacterial toxin-antitoxin,